MKKYKCIQEFYIEIYDDYGASTDKYMTIDKESIWYESNACKFIGGEVRLENYENNSKFTWIEISKESLERYFKLLGGGE